MFRLWRCEAAEGVSAGANDRRRSQHWRGLGLEVLRGRDVRVDDEVIVAVEQPVEIRVTRPQRTDGRQAIASRRRKFSDEN